MKVFNSTDVKVSPTIQNAKGEVDGIHIQPYGRVTLPDGYALTQLSMETIPGLVVEGAPAKIIKQTTK